MYHFAILTYLKHNLIKLSHQYNFFKLGFNLIGYYYFMNTTTNDPHLQSIELNDTLFKKITKTTLTQIEYIYLSANPSLSKNQIDYLFLQNIDNVNINLLRNKKCPKDKIDQFLALNDKIYNIAIAHNEKVEKEVYDKLLALNDFDVTCSLEYIQSIKKGL